MNRRKVMLAITVAAIGMCACGAEPTEPGREAAKPKYNELFLSNEKVALLVSPKWIIIGHKLDVTVDQVFFQVRNPADVGTPDSTNVVITVCDLDSDSGRATLAKLQRVMQSELQSSKPKGEWEVVTYRGTQGDTEYEILNCYRAFGKQLGVHCRLAYPLLKENSKEWTAELFKEFDRVLLRIRRAE